MRELHKERQAGTTDVTATRTKPQAISRVLNRVVMGTVLRRQEARSRRSRSSCSSGDGTVRENRRTAGGGRGPGSRQPPAGDRDPAPVGDDRPTVRERKRPGSAEGPPQQRIEGVREAVRGISDTRAATSATCAATSAMRAATSDGLGGVRRLRRSGRCSSGGDLCFGKTNTARRETVPYGRRNDEAAHRFSPSHAAS